MMAWAGDRTRRLHLFNCFTEICEPDARFDGAKASAVAGAGNDEGKLRPMAGIYDSVGGPGRVEACRDLLETHIGYPPGPIKFHRGWFQDTVPAADIDLIAILRLDGDWYESTKVCLEHLFDRVVPGGFIVIDDFGAYEGCRSATEEFFEM